MSDIRLNIFGGEDQKNIDPIYSEINEKNIIQRIWDKDYTVWSNTPDEITNRFGWLTSSRETLQAINEINEFVHTVKVEGFTHALLIGMGGSSLAPEVFKLTFGVEDGFLDLSVIDSTDPGAVLECRKKFDPAKTLYIISTKSGGTVETLSLMKYFYTFAARILGMQNAGKHFAAITDPGSGLASLARQLNFRKVFLNDPNIGGRYSALSFFGMVPAALLGVNLPALLMEAEGFVKNAKQTIDSNISAQLGCAFSALAKTGKDKLTFVISPKIAPIGVWIEQLIAESTGKNGKGILPVVDESTGEIESYSKDRAFVNIKITGDDSNVDFIEKIKNAGFPVVEIIVADIYQLGGQFFMWEFATVIAGWSLGIQPFDQPDVESAKIRAKEMLKKFQTGGELISYEPALTEDGIKIYGDVAGDSIETILQSFLSKIKLEINPVNNRSYVGINAFIKSSPAISEALQKLRTKIQTTYNIAVTTGYGPRFLHSTGQLHKGDAGNGLFIQLVGDMPDDLSIPDNPGSSQSSVTFGTLKTAQALGDKQALLDKGRALITIDLGNDLIRGINLLTNNIRNKYIRENM